ncbi:alpha/beta hydrolase [Luteococcus sediminum]
MALQEIEFTSHNGRDQIQAWVWSPVGTPRAVVQLVHGLGEHARRYHRLVSALVDAGLVVVADDHAGHGRTAMREGIWADAGDDAAAVVVADELTLQAKARELYPELPYVLFGHSWGSMIARVMATREGSALDGLALCGVAAQMRGIESVVDRARLQSLAAGDGAAEPAPDDLVGQLFDGFVERFGEDAGPTAWVAKDVDVVADHGRDPFNNFGAPLSSRFLQGFVALYDQANADSFYEQLPADLPVLILAGDQDPVANYGEGAYHVANRLRATGHDDVRTRVWSGLRHEVHNEPESRDEVVAELVEFVGRVGK